jgi:hypothetical protein
VLKLSFSAFLGTAGWQASKLAGQKQRHANPNPDCLWLEALSFFGSLLGLPANRFDSVRQVAVHRQ